MSAAATARRRPSSPLSRTMTVARPRTNGTMVLTTFMSTDPPTTTAVGSTTTTRCDTTMTSDSRPSAFSNKRRHSDNDEDVAHQSSTHVRVKNPALDFPNCVCTAVRARHRSDGQAADRFLLAVSLKSSTVMTVLDGMFQAHVSAVTKELQHGRGDLRKRVSAALTTAGSHSAWLPFVHHALVEVHAAAGAHVYNGELVVFAERLTQTLLGVARVVAPAKVAAVHASRAQNDGRMRSTMSRGVARRALDNLVAAAATAGAKSATPGNTPLELALRAVSRAPEPAWDSFVGWLESAAAAPENLGDACVPVATDPSIIVKMRDVRQAWLNVISSPEVAAGSLPAVAFVQPYLLFVREFMRMRHEILGKIDQ